MPRPLAVPAVLFLIHCALAAETARAARAVDYLTEDLRARVEKLKSNVRETATNPTNQTERARVLWDWANASALDGGNLPVNLTSTLTRALAYPEGTRGREAILDGYVEELTLIDEQPDALYVWAFEGQIGTNEACANPPYAWKQACEVLRAAKA